jgi:hypothetical protein
MSSKSLYRATVTGLVALGFVSLAKSNWPTVGGGSARHGQSPIIGPTSAQVLWQGTQSGWFGGQVYIEGDKLVLMRFQGLDYTPIVCHDLNFGAELWSVDFPGPGSRSVPIGFRDGQVYGLNFMESQHDTVYALNPVTGAIIWRAAHTVAQGIIASAIYTANGDLILAGSNTQLIRVNHQNGATIWATNRPIPNTGAEALASFGNKVYGWKGYINTDKQLTAWDMETGAELYSIALPGDGDQEIPHIVGPDGTLYLKRDGGLLYAIVDNGSGFSIRWTHSTIGAQTYSQWGVGLDGSVYVPDGVSIVRLEATTGNELNRSPALISSSTTLNARVTIGANGTLYVCNGGYADGAIYALSPDLQVLWSDPIMAITYAGPALGQGGALAVSGSGDILKIYRTAGSTITVTLEPINPPIVIPPGGGSFSFNATVTNNSSSPATTQVWIKVHLPDLSWYGPVLGPLSLTLPGNQSVTRLRLQNVPGSAPLGLYTYRGWAGTYPSAPQDSSSFTFSKLGSGNQDLEQDDWVCSGELFPGEVERTSLVSSASGSGATPTTNISPNPFNFSTTISYELKTASQVNLMIFDYTGRLVTTLVEGWREVGTYQVDFDGSRLASGLYLVKLQARDFATTSKIMLLK